MSHLLHLLLLNSSDHIRQKTEQALAAIDLPYALELPASNEEVSEQLKKNHWDAIIVDGTNGRFNVNAVFEDVRRNGDIPVIGIVNGVTNQLKEEAIKKGIHDLVPVDQLDQLPLALWRIVHLEKQMRNYELIENELQQKVRFLTDLFNAVQEGLCVMDTQLNILRTNSYFRSTFSQGLSPHGHKCYEILMRQKKPCSDCHLWEDLKNKGVSHETISFFDENKKTHWFEIDSYPLKNSEGQIIGVIQSIKDITSQKVAENKLVQLNKELDQRVKQRTAQLEAANKELEAFSYSVSHDLRAPLVRIDGFSQLLLDSHAEQLDEEGQHYLNRIRSSVLLMSELIDDLLDLSRVSRSELEVREVNLSDIAEKIIRGLKESEPQRKADVEIEGDLKVRGDARLLARALDNLFNNAWKFTSKREVAKIEFGVAQRSPVLVFFVRDNGAGFNNEYADQLFAPFRRLHSSKEFPGNGVGLATVQRIIHRHGGKIWAEGKVDRGAIFYFTLQPHRK